MKKLENKQTEVPVKEGVKATYADLIKIIVDAPRQTGIAISEMRERMKILEALEKGLEFEDSQVELLKKLSSEMLWGAFHKDFLMLADDIQNL